MSRPILLGVNIDHAATLRQARYRGIHASPHAEPSPLAFTREALAGGADGITVHLREDRRHIQEDDVLAIARLPGVRLNLEMACTPWMTDFARRLRPAAVCLVPESREEVTTEGGLEVAGQRERVAATVAALRDAGIEVSLFIGPEAAQLDGDFPLAAWRELAASALVPAAEAMAAEIDAVHLLRRNLGLFRGPHGDEREAAGAAGHLVHGDVDIGHRAELTKGRAKLVLGGLERQVTDVQFGVTHL